jgi:hypothetical protein
MTVVAIRSQIAVAAGTLVFGLAVAAPTEAQSCKKDAVRVGDACIDKWEASVWETTDAATIRKIRNGKITAAAQIVGTRRGLDTHDYGAGCPDNADGCTDFYAVSIPGVVPSSFITWFQAAAACRNAGKRLPTNQEWQLAALGTPDPGPDNGTTDCNTTSGRPGVATGSRSGCVSDVGAFDMVGNAPEWVADWAPRNSACAGWGPFSDDLMCLSGASTTAVGAGALLRGGHYSSGTSAGPFDVNVEEASDWDDIYGFRCARDP